MATTLTHPTDTPPARETARPATRGEERALLAAGAVLLLGLLSDGWAHTNIVEELESFLTPWHGLIGAGFALTGAVVLRVVAVRRTSGGGVRDGVPPGWGLALAGVFAFAIGFIGDGAWHTAFGIESDVDALLSPTHLLMAGAMLAIFTVPLRARDVLGRGDRLTAAEVTGAGFTGFVVAFFSLWGWTVSWGLGGAGLPEDTAAYQLGQTAGLAGPLLITGVLMGTTVALLRRGRPSVGALGLVVVAIPTAIAAIDEFDDPQLLLAFALGALALELTVHAPRPERTPAWLAPAAWAITTWSAFWILTVASFGQGWDIELYPGSVILCTALAASIAVTGRPSQHRTSPASR